MLQVKRIGHATLTTPDLERQLDYYTRVIGLSVVAKEKNRAVLATKPGQEVIVLEHGDRPAGVRLAFQVPPRSDLGALAAPLSKAGVKSQPPDVIPPALPQPGVPHPSINLLHADHGNIHPLAFEPREEAEINRACDFLGKKNIKLFWGPIRHGIGHNIAIYHKNPDGIIVEFFTDLDVMHDEDLGYFEPRPWHQDRPQRPKVWGDGTPTNYWGPGHPPEMPGPKK